MPAYAPVPTTPSISGIERLQLLAVALRQTAGDDQLLAAALRGGVLENRLGGFGFGRIDERARVDDDGVGATRVGLDPPAGGAEFGDHHLGVDQVLRAALNSRTLPTSRLPKPTGS